MRAVVLDGDTLHPEDLSLAPLLAQADDWVVHGATAPGEVAARIAGADIVLTNKVRLDASHLAAADRLKLVVILATGTNNVDLRAAREAGVDVCNLVGYSTPSVVQHTLSLMLALATRLPDYLAAVREGRWVGSPRFCLLDYPIREVSGMTLGIVGYGQLGQGVARAAEALGMRVLVAEGRSGVVGDEIRLPLPELLGRVDVLSLHCPLTEENARMINADTLSRMKPGAWLINTARGGLLDEAAVLDALQRGQLGGVALDVLAEEPPVAGHPLLAARHPMLLVTPHCAWGSRESRQRAVEQAAGIIAGWRDGRLVNCVNPPLPLDNPKT